MKETRLRKVITVSEAQESEGLLGFLRIHLNTILTVILLIAAVAMLIRWRMKTAENARLSVANDLAGARELVTQLAPNQLSQLFPADLIKRAQTVETQANATISSVLNSSDADENIRAQAFVLRGDLYWYLANLPEMPGAAIESTLRMPETSDQLLQKSFDSYEQVVKDSTLTSQHESLAIAHLGLGAIAENRHQWDVAQKEFEAVNGDASAPDALKTQARYQIDLLPGLKVPVYVAPASGVPTSQPTTVPIDATMPTTPLVVPATAPASATRPMPVPATLPIAPATRPVMVIPSVPAVANPLPPIQVPPQGKPPVAPLPATRPSH